MRNIGTQITAIPTYYAGLRMRSRLEATWAAFFDQCGWRWEYEPLELDCYIPDFVLRFKRPILVECKPGFDSKELRQYTTKLEQSGWQEEMLIVGSGFIISECNNASAGLLFERRTKPDPVEGVGCWADAEFHHCTECKQISFHHDLWTWNCRVCGLQAGDQFLGPIEEDELRLLWANAKNQVQWQRQ